MGQRDLTKPFSDKVFRKVCLDCKVGKNRAFSSKVEASTPSTRTIPDKRHTEQLNEKDALIAKLQKQLKDGKGQGGAVGGDADAGERSATKEELAKVTECTERLEPEAEDAVVAAILVKKRAREKEFPSLLLAEKPSATQIRTLEAQMTKLQNQ
ncbi:unnamed protein product, partial [Prorocentrum cordatum]